MKRTLMPAALLAFALLSVPALAADPPAPAAAQKDGDFDKRKSTALERIDGEIGLFQELRACVAAAGSREEMEKCREKFREAREAEKGRRSGN